MVSSPNVLEVASEHYGCNNVEGIEFEN